MRKLYCFVIVLGLAFCYVNNSIAQDFPWPDLGEAMVIEPGEPGKINDVIHGDTTDTGERIHNHFILKRGATYLYTARIRNSGYPLMVTAEEGTGPLPIIKALGPAPGEDEAERIFHAEGDLYIKDLVLNGWDQGGNYTDNATVRLAADGITVVCKNIIFDFNRQNNLRINSVDCKLYVEDCITANQGVAARLWQGFAVHFRGNWVPLVHMRNNTFYNLHHTVINNRNLARYQKFIFENNTIVNTGTSGSYFGRPDSLIVKNNLYVNVGILGDAIVGDRSEFTEPHYYFVVDSNFVDATNTELLDPYVEFENNQFYLDPAVAELLPDSANKATESMFHPYLKDLMGDNNEVKDEAFSFTNFPAAVSEYENYINDFYAFSDAPAEMPQFTTDFRDLDFSYSSSLAAYNAATDGGPLGDRNWFPDYVGIPELTKEFKIFPNPASDFLRIRDMEGVDYIEVVNLLGQSLIQKDNFNEQNVNVNVSDLQKGIYFITFYKNNVAVGYVKFYKQ